MPKRGTISDLKEELSEQTEIAADMVRTLHHMFTCLFTCLFVCLFVCLQMVVVDVYNSRFHRVYDNKENVSHILDRDDIYVLVNPLV